MLFRSVLAYLLGGDFGVNLGGLYVRVPQKAAHRFDGYAVRQKYAITVSPSFNSIVVAFGISVGIGVLFGYLPARRAARLNPIEALRYD